MNLQLQRSEARVRMPSCNADMKLTFLGTASCFPTPNRGVSCMALQLDDGQVWLFDCGEGSQIQLQKSDVRPGKISKVFITHLHGDHLFGLPGLLCTLGNGAGAEISEKQLDIYGPLGLRNYINTSLELSSSPLLYKYHIHEIVPKEDQYPPNWNESTVDFERSYKTADASSARKVQHNPSENCWELFETSNFRVKAGPIEHRIPSFAYVIEEKDQPGALDKAKLIQLGIKPGPIYGQLKRGEKVFLDDKTCIDPVDVLGPVKKGRKVAILGDTCNTSQIEVLCQNCHLLVHEATMENSLQEKAIEYGHSTPSMAAEFALKVNAKKLCMTHVSPRYKPFQGQEGSSPQNIDSMDATAKILLNEARDYVNNHCQRESNLQIEIAEDFYKIVL